jgi:UDP-2-acetamido-3-amino-2,3-dideoxy-glucuronate N-acetyltransferase
MSSPFIHPQALCETSEVGAGTRVWAFAHILPGARVGAGCNICDGVFIENGVTVGDRVTIKPGVQLWDGVTIEDGVFIGPNATFTNDKFPRSGVRPHEYARTVVRRDASIGANATILPGIEIGEAAMVGAGAVVTRSVPANAIVQGNPARIVGYVDDGAEPAQSRASTSDQSADEGPLDLGLDGPRLHSIRRFRDLRGNLTVGEFDTEIPFVPRRYFVVQGVPGQEVRGEHAHRQCHQFLICLRGSLSVLLDNGRRRREVVLDRPDRGLHIPPLTWGSQHHYTPDAILLVFASLPYDSADYIRSYGEFREVRMRLLDRGSS